MTVVGQIELLKIDHSVVASAVGDANLTMLGEFVWLSTSNKNLADSNYTISDEDVIVAASSFASPDSRYINLFKVANI